MKMRSLLRQTIYRDMRRLSTTASVNSEVQKLLTDKLRRNVEKAKNAERKLLIIVGESHQCRLSRESILFLMKTSRHVLGISQLAVELNRSAIQKMVSEAAQHINFYHYLKRAKADAWNVISVDKYHDLTVDECHAIGKSPMLIRDQGMIEELEIKLQDNGLMIVGANHLPGLHEKSKKIRTSHDMVFINTVNYKGHSYAGSREISWLTDSNNVEQLTVATDMKSISHALKY